MYINTKITGDKMYNHSLLDAISRYWSSLLPADKTVVALAESGYICTGKEVQDVFDVLNSFWEEKS